MVLTAAVAVLVASCGSAAPGPGAQYSSPSAIRAAAASGATGDAVVSGYLRAPGGPFLYDKLGRVVLLHGVNAVYKYAPFELYPDPGKPWNFSATDARRIAALGFDVVRLGILWEGLEPGHGGPNNPAICGPGQPGDPHMLNRRILDAYLAKVTKTVDLLGRYHVYTLLDMHQDIYSQPWRGEGAPLWAVCTDDQPIVPVDGRWSRNYANHTLELAESHFFDNDVVGNLQGQYDQVWAAVARHFADNPWVVGYDPYNEPYSQGVTSEGTADFAIRLECFYTGRDHPGTLAHGVPITCPATDPANGVIPTIERADHHHLVFFEPDNYSVRHGLPNLLGAMDFPRLVYNFHSYCGSRNPITGDPTDLQACIDQQLQTLGRRQGERPGMASRRQPGGPAWFMSEFGATTSAPLVDAVSSYADAFLLGWTYWAWKYYDDPTGSTHEALVSASGALTPAATALARPYPQATAGTPLSLDVDPDSNRFEYTYAPSARVTAPTVIYVPGRSYPHGYCALVEGGSITSVPGASHLTVTASSSAGTVTVDIDPAHCRPGGPG